MISLKYVPATCILLTLAIIPTVIHSYGGGASLDGRSTQAIPNLLAGYQSAATNRNPEWGKRRFDSDDWIEREYREGNGRESVRLTVIRSFDAKRLYHHPEVEVVRHTTFNRERILRFSERPDVPVHVLKSGDGGSAAGMYVLHYENRFVDDPVLFQIRAAGELLFSRRQPMTLFFVLGSSVPEGAELETVGSLRVLFAAIDAFVQQKPPSEVLSQLGG